MRKKAILIALSCIITGCTVNRNHQGCPAYSQCDELYPSDYNCDIQQRTLSTIQYPTTYAPVPLYYNNRAYRCDFYGNVLQPNEYMSRDVNGRPIVGDVTRPNAPSTNRPRPSIYHNHGNNSGNNGIDNSNPNIHRKPVNNAPSSRKKRN